MKTMKKTLIISAIAAAFLGTGCVSNDVFSPEEKQVEICFTTPVVGSMTKAPVYGEINGTTYDPKENFVIYGVRHPDSYDGWTSDNATTYINGGVFTHDSSYDDETEGTKGGWKGLNTKYYWPESGVLSFGGYSPAGIQGTFTYNAAGLKIESFAIKTNAAEHQDLMYAERVYNKKNNTTDANNATYDGVDIAFKHALSSIQFKVQLSADYSSTFKLTSIKVGRVKYSGTFTENITEEFDEVDGKKTLKSSENNPSWSVADNQILNTTPYVAFSGSVQLNKNTGDDAKNYINQYLALDGVDGQNDLILMPQVLPDEAELEIVYTGNGKEESSTVKLSDLNIKEWVMGQRYTYNITLGYDLILVGATVKNWDEEDDVNIPIN
jgi:hypothetical protein